MTPIGKDIYALAETLFPICRSLTGPGVRQTLARLQKDIPNLRVSEVPSGTTCFDWEIPNEWTLKDAYILDPSGKKIVDFQNSNLHVVGYAIPVNQEISFQELKKHLFYIEKMPDAIPYMTSYYSPFWGFCLTYNQFKSLKEGTYKVVIDSDLKPGSLTYGEVLFQGQSEKEIFLSTDICHPSMGNNELSGPCVQTFIAKWLQAQPTLNYSYRLVFVPETIGSIAYLSKNLATMKKNIVAGYNLSCIGDNRAYSYLASRNGHTLSDTIAQHVLKHKVGDYKTYSFLDRGSDERQYCAPGVDLPIASLMRTKYGEYPEYHTSADDLQLISPEGLGGGYEIVKTCLETIENNHCLKAAVPCEPQLGKRGLYPSLSTKETHDKVKNMMNLLAYCDGSLDILGIANQLEVPMWDLVPIAKELEKVGLLKRS